MDDLKFSLFIALQYYLIFKFNQNVSLNQKKYKKKFVPVLFSSCPSYVS